MPEQPSLLRRQALDPAGLAAQAHHQHGGGIRVVCIPPSVRLAELAAIVQDEDRAPALLPEQADAPNSNWTWAMYSMRAMATRWQ
jgi:hypothetical protein